MAEGPGRRSHDECVGERHRRNAQIAADPAGEQPDRGRCEYCERRAGGEGQRREQEESGGDAGLRAGPQLGADAPHPGPQFRDRAGGLRVDGTDELGQAGLLGDVPVGVDRCERCVAIALVGAQEAVHQRVVDPAEQMRIVGRVGPAVGCRSDHGLVDPTDDGHCLRGLFGGPERGRTHVGTGAPQPAGGVGPVGRMVGDAGHRERVHRLQEQGADTADEDRGIAVHGPGRTTGSEEAGVTSTRSSDVGNGSRRADQDATDGSLQ